VKTRCGRWIWSKMFLIPKEVENKARFSWGCECRHQNAEASKRGLRGGIRQFSSLLRCVAKIPCRKEVTRFFFENVYLHYSLWLICTITPSTPIYNPNPRMSFHPPSSTPPILPQPQTPRYRSNYEFYITKASLSIAYDCPG